MKKLIAFFIVMLVGALACKAEVMDVDTTIEGGEIPNTVWSEDGIGYMVIDSDMHEVAVIDITDKVFDKWGYIDPVTVPASVVHDGIEYNVVCIGRDTFNQSTQVNLPNSIIQIEPDCFNSLGYNVNGKVTFSFPQDLSVIENGCFNYTQLLDIQLPARLKTIGSDCFTGNESLTSIEMGKTIRSIGNNSFSSNNLVKEILLPNSLYRIGENAFCDCIGLERVRLPRYLPFEYGNPMGELKIFNGCPNIRIIEWDSETPSDPINSFDAVDKANCTVIVPDGCEEAYQKSNYWKEFNIVEKSNYQASLDQIKLPTKESDKPEYYTIEGLRMMNVRSLEKGRVYLKVSSGGTQRRIK